MAGVRSGLLNALVLRHWHEGGGTAIERLSLIRADAPSGTIGVIYRPSFCLVLQGKKAVYLGERSYTYGAGEYLIASIDVPVTGQVTGASATEPYLAVALELDLVVISTVLVDAPDAIRPPADGPLSIGRVSDDLLDPVARLVGLLDRPADIAALAPLIEREIVYRLVSADPTGLLRQVALADSAAARIARAIGWIRRCYAEPLRIETVAAMVGMSVSAFHRNFKAFTHLSPLRYQKLIRLQEARRLLIGRAHDVAAVGLRVGYESPSQFSREYGRLFGVSPGRDRGRLRVAVVNMRQPA